MKTVRFTESARKSCEEIRGNIKLLTDPFPYGLFVDSSFRNGIDSYPEGKKDFLCRDTSDDTIYFGSAEDESFQVPDAAATTWIAIGLLMEV